MRRKNITFGDCNTFLEVTGHVRRHEEALYSQDERIEKLEAQLAYKRRKKDKKKGSVIVKTLVGIAVFAVLLATAASARDITYTEAANPVSLRAWLNDNVYPGYYVFTPQDAAPVGSGLTEGAMYYNDGTNTLYFCSDGATWTAIGAASGNSLDEAYNSSSKITVDTGVIEFEAADGLGVAALLIDYDDVTTNAMDAVQITNAGDDGAAVSLQIDSTAGYDIQGTGDLWNVSYVGLGLFKGGLTLNTGGELLVSARDVLFDDTYDVAWDTSADMLIFQDNAVLGIGGAHDGAADLTIKGDATNVLIEVATEDAADLLIGYTNALDVKFHAATNTSFMIWDISAAELIFDAADLRLNDDDQLFFGDGATDSFSIDFDEVTDNLVIVATTAHDAVQIGDGTTATDVKFLSTAADTAAFVHFDASGDTNNGQMKFGADDHGQDVIFYGASASQMAWWDQSADTWYFGADAEGVDVYLYGDTTVNYALWDETDNRLEMVAADIMFDDNGDLIFGSGSDWTVESDTAKTLEFIPVTADGSSAFHIGTAAATADVLIYGETASELITWDAGADSLTVVGDLSLFTMTGTTQPFTVDVTGTVAGVAIALDTTNGGISLDADGSDNGDIAINAADDMTLTVAGDLTFAVTGDTTLPDDMLRKAVVAIAYTDVDGLMGTPQSLIATPGASSMIEFVSAVIALDYSGTAYTESDDNLAIRYTDGDGVIVSEAIEATGFADATADTVLFVSPLADGTNSIVAETAAVNQALVLDNTGNGEWATGTSPIVVIIYYRIHTVTDLGL